MTCGASNDSKAAASERTGVPAKTLMGYREIHYVHRFCSSLTQDLLRKQSGFVGNQRTSILFIIMAAKVSEGLEKLTRRSYPSDSES